MKLPQNIVASVFKEDLQLSVPAPVSLTRFEAIQLRNFLNKFINGELEEENEDEQ